MKSVIRTLSNKYQLTIPKRFGKDLGLNPPAAVTITEDTKTKRIIIEPLIVFQANKADKKAAFIEACQVLGKKWAKLGVTEKDVDQALREFRSAA